jgi:hypothetical protein
MRRVRRAAGAGAEVIGPDQWALAALRQGMPLAEVVDRMMDADPWWTPERRAAADAFYLKEWEQEVRRAHHFRRLRYYQEHGIKQGMQDVMLTYIAAWYARDFTTRELADELWKVMEASPQDRRDPWRPSHAYSKAVRAHRFIEREDAKEAAWMPGLMAWAQRVTAQTQQQVRRQRFDRWARREVIS